jgi:flagella basal body P-ring formation protein FlgA
LADHAESASHANVVIRDQKVAVVHAGDLVQAWRQEPNLRIELAGRAEESGMIGSHVRVRVLHSGFDSGQPLTVTGIVRGPGNVEIFQ